MTARPGHRLRVTARDIDREGRGVATAEGLEIHAQGLCPGESGLVAIDHVSKRSGRGFGHGQPDEPGADRVEPACVGQPCGGCAWQHLAYPAQLLHKRRRVTRALAALAAPPTVAEVVGAASPTGYRNKATYVLAEQGGAVALGAYAPRSHDWVDTSRCVVVRPAIASVVPTIARALTDARLPVYDERQRTGCLRYAVVRSSRAGQVLVGLVATSTTPDEPLQAAASAIASQTQVAGVVAICNDAHSGVIVHGPVRNLVGQSSLTETVCGVPIDVAIDTFVQIHLDQAERLYQRLADLVCATGPVRAIDLYCGVGAIGFALANRSSQVVGVERNPTAVELGNRAAARAGLHDRLSLIAESASDSDLTGLVGQTGAEVVVVNPPRQGLTAEVRASLRRARPATIAYVSCGPESLARDLADLADAYGPTHIEPFDLMPGTGHVETLVIMVRR